MSECVGGCGDVSVVSDMCVCVAGVMTVKVVVK